MSNPGVALSTPALGEWTIVPPLGFVAQARRPQLSGIRPAFFEVRSMDPSVAGLLLHPVSSMNFPPREFRMHGLAGLLRAQIPYSRLKRDLEQLTCHGSN